MIHSRMNEVLPVELVEWWNDASSRSELSSILAPSHMWLLNTWKDQPEMLVQLNNWIFNVFNFNFDVNNQGG